MSLKLHVWLRSIHLWEASVPCSWKLPKAAVPFQSKQLPNTLLGGSDGLIAWFFSRFLPIKWNENNLRSSTPTCCSRSATKSARPVSKVWRQKRSKAAIYGHLRPKKYRFLQCFTLFENLITHSELVEKNGAFQNSHFSPASKYVSSTPATHPVSVGSSTLKTRCKVSRSRPGPSETARMQAGKQTFLLQPSARPRILGKLFKNLTSHKVLSCRKHHPYTKSRNKNTQHLLGIPHSVRLMAPVSPGSMNCAQKSETGPRHLRWSGETWFQFEFTIINSSYSKTNTNETFMYLYQ